MAHPFKVFLYHHKLTAKLYTRIRNYRYDKRKQMSDLEYAQWSFKQATGKELNLETPVTFDEKIQYLKLFDRNPLKPVCSEKYNVRQYVKDCGLENILNDVYGVYHSFEEIDFDKLPEECFIKCTHTSGANVIFNRNKPFDYMYYRYEFDFWLQRNYYWNSREWNYRDIPARIICEPVLRDQFGRLPMDYKFFCFGGEVKIVSLDIGVASEEGEHALDYYRNIYDRNFELLPVTETRKNYEGEVKKPEKYELMVEYAEILSKPFRHCRVDLYNVDGKIYFGEITFHHGSGCNHFQPEEWAVKLGSYINIEGLRANG